ncbi:MAG TPA: FtsQ-type POTRA domain-containing protein [Fibrobacteria bacterium]|nr:FtsQ-type POTRA domain-containing protein [Fibrobacteria bacterium]
MKRAKPGSAGAQRGTRFRGNEGRILRNVPPPARRGVNSQKSDKVRSERERARRTGLLRRAWAVLRTSVLAAAVTGGLGAAGWAGWRAFENNGFLALRQVDVVGNKLVGKAAILEKAGLELGTKLPAVPVKRIEAALRSLPGVGEADVRRIFPSRIEIRVREKEPVAVGYARGWYGLAPDGSRIAGLDWGRSDLPVVDGFAGLDPAARAALGAFLDGAKRGHPGLYANFSQLALRGNDGLEIILRDGRLKVLVGLDLPSPAPANSLITQEKATSGASNKSLNSLEFLQALIDQQSAAIDVGRTVDLRVYGYAYVR